MFSMSFPSYHLFFSDMLKNVQAKEDNANTAALSLIILASTGAGKMKKLLTY